MVVKDAASKCSKSQDLSVCAFVCNTICIYTAKVNNTNLFYLKHEKCDCNTQTLHFSHRRLSSHQQFVLHLEKFTLMHFLV